MSKNKSLFEQAIADAKAVREAALLNAKAALEEALTPKIQSMISAKLREQEEEELDENQDENLDEMMDDNASYGDEGLEEDFDLNSILAELDDEDELDEAKDDDKKDSAPKKKDSSDSKPKPKSDSSPKQSHSEESSPEDEKISSLTVAEFKDLISDVIASAGGMGASDMGDDLGGDDMGDGMDDMGGDDMGAGSDMGGDDMNPPIGGEEDDSLDEDDFDLNELLSELDALNEEEEDLEEAKIQKWPAGKKAIATTSKLGYKQVGKTNMNESKELAKAIQTIKTLRSELNEVNLFNAKMLYVNKIFKAQNLNESQKVKVLASFDKARTTQEAKLIYESLQTTIGGKANNKKQMVKESLGFASKALGVSPRKQIVESNDVISRMQKLANII